MRLRKRERIDRIIIISLKGERERRSAVFFFFVIFSLPSLAFRFISKAVFPRARALSLKSETILRNNFETFQRDLVPWPRRNET